MTTTTFESLYESLLNVIDEGDEEKAKQFLTDHFNEFPEAMQSKIALAFFEEAVTEEAEGASALADFQKEGLETMTSLKKLKKTLENDEKIQNLRKEL